jgi:hypothetical protein
MEFHLNKLTNIKPSSSSFNTLEHSPIRINNSKGHFQRTSRFTEI